MNSTKVHYPADPDKRKAFAWTIAVNVTAYGGKLMMLDINEATAGIPNEKKLLLSSHIARSMKALERKIRKTLEQ